MCVECELIDEIKCVVAGNSGVTLQWIKELPSVPRIYHAAKQHNKTHVRQYVDIHVLLNPLSYMQGVFVICKVCFLANRDVRRLTALNGA